MAYAADVESDRRRGRWLDPDGAQRTVAAWAASWVQTLDVETRTEENYRAHLRNHVLPRWGCTTLGQISALGVTVWVKDLRTRLAAATVAGIVTVLSMMLEDAVDERLIVTNPVHRRRRRGRRRERLPLPAERVWAMPEQVLRIAEQAGLLGGPSAGLLVITAAWTGCRWGELAGLQREHVFLDSCRDRGVMVVDQDTGALHESGHRLWLGPPKTPASARTITLPPFLVALLREYLASTSGGYVFTSPLGHRLRRSTFDRRVFRPAVDGNTRAGTRLVRPGLTFHGLRHSHKTWLIAEGIPEIAQARRLGHHLSNRLVETYSHVAPQIEHRLLRALQQRWRRAQRLRRPVDNRPYGRSPGRAPHTRAALRSTAHRHMISGRPQLPTTVSARTMRIRQATSLPNSSTSVPSGDQRRDRSAIIDRVKRALRPGTTPTTPGIDQEWS